MKRTRLLEIRKQKQLTQAFIAERVGINRSYYGLIENGSRNPSLIIAKKIAQTLDVTIEIAFPEAIFFNKKCYNMKQ